MPSDLTPAMRAFLDEVRFAVIATIGGRCHPQQTVMWYQREEDSILFNTAVGRAKDRNLQRDPRISFLVEDGYRFFRAHGRVNRITDRAQTQDHIRRLAIRYHGEQQGEKMAREYFSTQERISYRMPIARVYTQGF
jgi:PPOX class probable F420-dependent enzyme